MIRVLLLEDHASFRQALASIIEREPDVTVVAQAGSLAEARALLPLEVDVAVVDLGLPDGEGHANYAKRAMALRERRLCAARKRSTRCPPCSTRSAIRSPT